MSKGSLLRTYYHKNSQPLSDLMRKDITSKSHSRPILPRRPTFPHPALSSELERFSSLLMIKEE